MYPAASLKAWTVGARKYKGSGPDPYAVRQTMVAELQAKAPWFDAGNLGELMLGSDDLFDAVVASLTAGAVAAGQTILPPPGTEELAATEGWIHLPSGELGALAHRMPG